jgi:hypothetical protein
VLKPFSQVVLLSRVGALICTALFFVTTFRSGWNHEATDFRNYYTGAVLARKSQPLRNYYDWTWFQRQVSYAGSSQLGAFVPQTPLAMLPLLPVSGLPLQTAKRYWLVCNLAFLGGTLWMLSRLTGLRVEKIALLAFLGYGTLHTNFLFGQYYVFVLFLFTASLFCLEQSKESGSGFLLSAAFALKLYGGPFLLYLCVKRRRRATVTMLVGILCWTTLVVALFSWSDMVYFGAHILPRALEGETIDPYNSLNNTVTTLLRRVTVMEPELNPHPFWNMPWAFFFLQPLILSLILGIPLLASVRSTDLRREFAWFVLAVLLVSPNMGSYSFVLAFLPVVLLLENASMPQKVFLMVCYALLAIPLRPDWSWFFPKVWLMLALFMFAARGYWHLIRPAEALAVACLLALVAAISAQRHLASYRQEPGQKFEQVAVQPGSIFASSPAVVRLGIVYQAISVDRYVLRFLHGERIEEFRFDGQALNPVAMSPDGPIQFELVADRKSTNATFDIDTKRLRTTSVSVDDHGTLLPSKKPYLESPDRMWLVFVKPVDGSEQIWVKNEERNEAVPITGGNCNSWSPAWELDSKGIVFASDCNRGINCPALYRARFSDSWPMGSR